MGASKKAAFAFQISDPTVIFAIVCGIFPALKARDPAVVVQYISDPVCIGVAVLTVIIYAIAVSGKKVPLEKWENRAATWYLLNAAIFHLMLDFGVGNLKALPVMQQNYQAMDLRYGCVAEHACGDLPQGNVKPMEGMVWLLTWIEAVVDAPLCYLVFIAYVRGWACRQPLELITCTSHFIGTAMFMGTEFYDGLKCVPPRPNNVGGENGMFENLLNPIPLVLDLFENGTLPDVAILGKLEAQFSFFWFAFLLCNCAWYVIPFRLGAAAYKDILSALEKKEGQLTKKVN